MEASDSTTDIAEEPQQAVYTITNKVDNELLISMIIIIVVVISWEQIVE